MLRLRTWVPRSASDDALLSEASPRLTEPRSSLGPNWCFAMHSFKIVPLCCFRASLVRRRGAPMYFMVSARVMLCILFVWRWMISPHCILRAFMPSIITIPVSINLNSLFKIFPSLISVSLSLSLGFHVYDKKTFPYAMSRRVYLLWYVCSRGPSRPFLSSPPARAYFLFCSAAASLRASRGLPVGPELAPALRSRTQIDGVARGLRRAANVGYDPLTRAPALP